MARGPGVTFEATQVVVRAGCPGHGHRRLGLGRPAAPAGAGGCRARRARDLLGRAPGRSAPTARSSGCSTSASCRRRGFTVACFPLKIVGGSAGPTRAVAIVPCTMLGAAAGAACLALAARRASLADAQVARRRAQRARGASALQPAAATPAASACRTSPTPRASRAARGLVSFRGRRSPGIASASLSRPTGRTCCASSRSSHKATVWIDGRLVARHTGAYLPFEVRAHADRAAARTRSSCAPTTATRSR